MNDVYDAMKAMDTDNLWTDDFGVDEENQVGPLGGRAIAAVARRHPRAARARVAPRARQCLCVRASARLPRAVTAAVRVRWRDGSHEVSQSVARSVPADGRRSLPASRVLVARRPHSPGTSIRTTATATATRTPTPRTRRMAPRAASSPLAFGVPTTTSGSPSSSSARRP